MIFSLFCYSQPLPDMVAHSLSVYRVSTLMFTFTRVLYLVLACFCLCVLFWANLAQCCGTQCLTDGKLPTIAVKMVGIKGCTWAFQCSDEVVVLGRQSKLTYGWQNVNCWSEESLLDICDILVNQNIGVLRAPHSSSCRGLFSGASAHHLGLLPNIQSLWMIQVDYKGDTLKCSC